MYNTSKYYSYIYIYADRNVRPWTIQGYTLATFPKVTQYIYAQPEEEIGKRTLHNWWRISGQQVFYPAKGKLNKDKEGRNSQPSRHQEKDNTKLRIIFLFYI